MSRSKASLFAAASGLAAFTLASGGDASETNESSLAVATLYYQALAGQRDFASVPMADALTFSGPGRSAASAAAFRQALAGLAPRVRGFALRHQLAGDEFVMSFYDLDLGVPDGPIPMAERLRMVDGQIVEVELLFDSRRMPSPPPADGS